MALDSTIGGSASNSYCSLIEADAYFADRLNGSTFTGQPEGIREKALVTATRRIDEETFVGTKVNLDQRLQWPRFNVYDEDGLIVSHESIPERVKQAVYMTAFELMRTDFLQETYMDNFSFFSVGSVQLKQFTPQSAGKLPAEALRLLRRFMTSGSSGGRLIRA